VPMTFAPATCTRSDVFDGVTNATHAATYTGSGVWSAK
jgi:hypothetical protein